MLDVFWLKIGSSVIPSWKVLRVGQLVRYLQFHYVTSPLAHLLRRLEDSPAREAILLVTPRLDDETHASIERLLRRGHHVALLDVSEEQAVLRRFEAMRPTRQRRVMS